MAVKITLTGDDKSLSDALRKAAAKVKALGDEYDKAGDKAKEAGEDAKKGSTEAERAAMRQLAFAKRLVRQNETAMQTYKRQLRALLQARRENTITAQQYRQTVDSLKRKIREAGDEAVKTKRKSAGMFDVTKLAAFASGFISISSAIAVVNKALQFFNQEKDKALEIGDTLEGSRMRLAQIAGGDAQKLQGLENLADTISTDTGMDRAAARNLVFDMTSGGMTAEQTRGLAAFAPVFGAQAVSAVPKTTGLFGGQVTPQQTLSGIAKAAEQSDADFEAIARVAPMVAEGARGMDAGGALGVLSALTSQFKSPEVAATRIKGALAKTKMMGGFEGMGVLQSLDELVTRRDEDMIKNNQEVQSLLDAYIGSRGVAVQRTAEINEQFAAVTGGGGLASELLRSRFDETTAQGQRNLSRRRKEIELRKEELGLEEDFAIMANQAVAARAQVRQASREVGANAAARMSADFGAGISNTLGGTPEQTQATGALFGGFFSNWGAAAAQNPYNPPEVNRQFQQETVAVQKEMLGVMGDMNNKMENQPLQQPENQGQ